MAIISRKYNFVGGTTVDPLQMNAELNQLINAHNDHDQNKVDKIAGKGLSTNDFTDQYKSDADANTLARHTHGNKTLLDTYTQSEANLSDAVAKKHFHSNKTVLDQVLGVTTTLGNDPTKVPTEKAVADAMVKASLGDMLKLVYDPQGYDRDVFDYINKKLSASVSSPSVGIGMNSVIRLTDNMEAIPKVTMQGKSYVNLLGKDGNCETTTPWLTSLSSIALDSANKVFGANGLKITISGASGSAYQLSRSPDATKYYLISAYLKNGNATNVFLAKDNGGGGVTKTSTVVTSTTEFTRVGIKCQPSDINAGNTFAVYVAGTTGQCAYVDGIMWNEISATDYANLTVDQLLDKYPYIDSYACLQNPYIEVRHDNLVRNGNCEEGIAWWSAIDGNTLPVLYGGKFRIISPGTRVVVGQYINVKPNTSYYFSGNITMISGSSAIMRVYDTNLTGGLLRNGAGGTFTSGASGIVLVTMYCDAGTYDFDSIMLIEGTTAPSAYKPCRIERCVVEGKFTSDDLFTLENGEVTGLLNWKHRTLYGKDYDWHAGDATGHKMLATSPNAFIFTPNSISSWGIGIKYDGKVLRSDGTTTTPDCYWMNISTGQALITIADSDTGWAETIAPNNDEVKAYMNGWKAIWNTGTRYNLWTSVLCSTPETDVTGFPSGTATTLTVATSGTTSITVADASMFKVGDSIGVYGNTATTISSISGNVIAVATAQTARPIGRTVFRLDNPTSSDTRILTYCKNNIAPNYTGYQLHYKLVNPEPITDATVRVVGDIPKLDNGDNYLYVDSGMVLREVANAGLIYAAYYINSPNTYLFKQKAEGIKAIFKNLTYDSKWAFTDAYIESRGRFGANIAQADFDPAATYTVDYQILKTMHTSPTTITCTYQQDVLNAISDLAEVVENKQNADSALDMLIDKSIYEKIDGISQWGRFYHSASGEAMYVVHRMADKKCNPVATISNLSMNCLDFLGGIITIPLSDIGISVNSSFKNLFKVEVAYIGSNATIKSNLLDYGGSIGFTIELDCRGRL